MDRLSIVVGLRLLMVPIALLVCVCLQAQAMSSSNAIDNCWRRDVNWAKNRMKLADCATGFGSSAYGGKGGEIYTVTTDKDDAANPLPGSLRYGATREGPVWIVFEKDMNIILEMPLFISSYKTIDGRGASVDIGMNGPCIRIWNVTNVIVHGLNIHDCKPSVAADVMLSQSTVQRVESQDGDAISIVTSKHIWIDHNTLSASADGLIDVTLASTAVTISNNRFSNHDKVMLLGHSDDFSADKDMKVTVVYNHFGPALMQRMPRCRFGYVHVANNNYEDWGIYAIGGSMHPTILSEGNRFVAPNEEYKKQVTWRERCSGMKNGSSCDQIWLWKSLKDKFENGAYFVQSGRGSASPTYKVWEMFSVGNAGLVESMTKDAGALSCIPTRLCL